MSDRKGTLLRLVEREAFDPVLRAKPEGRPESEKKRLKHVQDATRSEVDRYRSYRSAEELVTNFRRDLTSSAAKKVHAELHSLNLPTIEDIRDEFERKVKELGVGGGS